MITQEVNVIALAKAAEMVVGVGAAQAIAQMYRVLDDAMFAGYELGRQDGEADAQGHLDDAFDNGYGNGYVDGVGDARVRPAFADERVEDIIYHEDAQQAAFAFMEPEFGCDCGACMAFAADVAFYQGDSGDETDR